MRKAEREVDLIAQENSSLFRQVRGCLGLEELGEGQQGGQKGEQCTAVCSRGCMQA